MNASYEDDELRIYSQKATGTFSDDDEEEFDESDFYEEQESYSEIAQGMSSSASAVEALKVLREIERKVDYEALTKTDEYHEEAFRFMSDGDREIVSSLRDYFVENGVIEDPRYMIETALNDSSDGKPVSVTAESLFHDVMSLAQDDIDVNPDVDVDYHDSVNSEEDEEIWGDELFEDNPHIDEDDDEYKELIGYEEVKESSETVITVPSFDDENVQEEPVYPLLKTSSSRFVYDNVTDSGESQKSMQKGGRMSIEDIVMIKKMFDVGKLSDSEIADIFGRITEEEVGLLRAEISR